MNRPAFKVVLFLLLLYLLIDGMAHKGMVVTLLPAGWYGADQPYHVPVCKTPLQITKKRWTKAVNTTAKAMAVDPGTGGVEIDVYYDDNKNDFLAFHDSSETERPMLSTVLEQLRRNGFKGGIWLDIKNLEAQNEQFMLKRLLALDSLFQLRNRIVVESSYPQHLSSFCRAGYFTSYYVPFFNPYRMTAGEREAKAKELAEIMNRYPTSAVSGYYFQYPFLARAFPGMPVLTWVNDPSWSLVNYFFQRKLEGDGSLFVILEGR